ncbi:MAG: hypothetical protein ABIJ83_04650 [Patescibacteria group bacterium]|nr:hypothetical protein [Patescibacteria group bacterium]
MYKNLILITIVASLTIISQVFLKKGLKTIGEFKLAGLHDFGIIIKLLQNKFIVIGILIAIIGALFWLTVISKLDLTIAFPISSGIFFILLFLMSWIFLGESITFIKITGIAIILLGIYLIF